MHRCKWKGRVDSVSGDAEFEIGDRVFTMQLSCFDDYRAINNMLDRAFLQGKIVSAEEIRKKIANVMDLAVNNRTGSACE